jgi:proline racemase
MIHRIRTIDAHAAGEPLRLIVDGFPSPEGRTMLQKRAWLRQRADHLRRALMLEPRGHTDMYGAVLTEPVNEGSDAGVLFMHNEGYSTMCGHGTIAVVTVALERGLIVTSRQPEEIVLDAPAGQIRARPRTRRIVASIDREQTRQDDRDADCEADVRPAGIRVDSVAFLNVPSFVLNAGVPVRLGSREVRVDVAFGGAFYAIVDSEAAGLPLELDRLQDLRAVGMEIKRAVEARGAVTHPLEPGLHGIYGTIFTGPGRVPAADLRNVTIFADAEVDRSPCGTGTCAVMAVLDAMGVLPDDRPFVHESLIGTLFYGRVRGRTTVGEIPALVPEIEGSAWITGEHTFLVDDEDPLKEGFRI